MQQTFTESPAIWKGFTITFGIFSLLQLLGMIELVGEIGAIDSLFVLFFLIAFCLITFFLVFLPKWVAPTAIVFAIFETIISFILIADGSELMLLDYLSPPTVIGLALYTIISNEAKMHAKFAERSKKTTRTTHKETFGTTTISSDEEPWTSPQDTELKNDKLIEKGFNVVRKVKNK